MPWRTIILWMFRLNKVLFKHNYRIQVIYYYSFCLLSTLTKNAHFSLGIHYEKNSNLKYMSLSFFNGKIHSFQENNAYLEFVCTISFHCWKTRLKISKEIHYGNKFMFRIYTFVKGRLFYKSLLKFSLNI
jgi:hypothetical protein